MKIGQIICNCIIKHASFPDKCETGLELNWMLKGNCPCCIGKPIEHLSNEQYHKKYPARNKLSLGVTTVYLCDVHLEQLRELFVRQGRD